MAEHQFEANKECENCVEEKAAIAHCGSCNLYLCEECLRQHKRQRNTKDHEVVVSESAVEERRKSLCPTHNDEEVKFYCCDCEKPICLHCTVSCCNEHTKNVANDVRFLLRENFTAIKEKATKFESHVEHIESVKQKNNTEMTRCEEDIKQTFEELMEQLKEKRERLINELHEANGVQQETIKEHEDNVKRKWEELKKNVKATEELLSSRQESKLMVERDNHLSKMKELAEYDWSTEQVKPSKWQIRAPPKEDYAERFGQILPKPEPCNVTVEMEETVTIGESNEFTVQVEPIEQIKRCKVDKEISVKIVLTRSSQGPGTLLARTVKKLSINVWSVSYFPRRCGELSIAVSVCGIEAESSPFRRAVTDRIKKGDKVVRGVDWKWDDQDGGSGKIGEVIEVKGNGWISVRWNGNKKSSDYRWGKDGKFDVKLHLP